jgi:hypothetical protein
MLLDPRRSPGCVGTVDDGEVGRTVCALRAPNEPWEKGCLATTARERDESAQSCADLAAPGALEGQEIAIDLKVSFGSNGRERGMIHVQGTDLKAERLCLHDATIRRYASHPP